MKKMVDPSKKEAYLRAAVHAEQQIASVARAGARSVRKAFSAHTAWLIIFLVLFILTYVVEYGVLYLFHTISFNFNSLLHALRVVFGTLILAALLARFTAHGIGSFFASAEIPEEKFLIRKFYVFALYVIACSYALWYMGYSASNLTILIGLATTGFAFAIRDVVSSYFVWFMLLTKRPFRIGDYIRIGDDEGRVIHIGTFYVILDDTPERTEDNIRVPNKRFMELPFYNYGRTELLCQVRVPLPSLMQNIDARLEAIKKDLAKEHPSPKVLLDAAPNGVYIYVETYTTESSRHATRDKILRAVLRELSKETSSRKNKK